jgi:PEP-CTERM motif
MGRPVFRTPSNIDRGSIDALMTTRMGTQGYDNTLTVHTRLSLWRQWIRHNQWFNIRDTAGPIVFFTASSTQNAFEFDMGSSVPEPST